MAMTREGEKTAAATARAAAEAAATAATTATAAATEVTAAATAATAVANFDDNNLEQKFFCCLEKREELESFLFKGK